MNRFQVLQHEPQVKADHVDTGPTEKTRVVNVGSSRRNSQRPQVSKPAKNVGQKPKPQSQQTKPQQSQQPKPQQSSPVHKPRVDTDPSPTVNNSDLASQQAASKAVKEREKVILKMINQKQDSLWKEFQARKHADEELWNAHVVPQSEEELAHISKLLGVNTFQQPKPPDITIDDVAGGDEEKVHISLVGQRSEKQSSQNA
ncbi:hypothetical protein RIF29_41510 [Crotalaria pallida]|uniref:Uncharacterized protein n=1 Tax=Crotalaria pallida TaxID=3830 RepID=A0AAN9EAP5_CROPI